jgi:hypothetical protein
VVERTGEVNVTTIDIFSSTFKVKCRIFEDNGPYVYSNEFTIQVSSEGGGGGDTSSYTISSSSSFTSTMLTIDIGETDTSKLKFTFSPFTCSPASCCEGANGLLQYSLTDTSGATTAVNGMNAVQSDGTNLYT